MPPKYSHVKKRSAAGLLKPGASTASNLIKETYDPNNPHGQQQQYHQHIQLNTNHFPILGIQPNSILPNIDKNLSQAMAAVAHLERAIARVLLLRYEYDIARLYSTRLHVIALTQIPILVAKLAEQGGAGWVAMNSESEEVKDFFRAIIGMDMREAGERVATKSVLWSYTALRRFALSHNVPICPTRGLHSLRLLPFYPDLKAHLDSLEEKSPPTFEKPAFFGGLESGYRVLEEACVAMGWDLGIEVGRNYDLTIPSTMSVLPEGQAGGPVGGSSHSATTTTHIIRTSPADSPHITNAAVTYTLSPSAETRLKLRLGYTRLVQTLWKVAREFDVRGYGQVLRDKLTVKWCECGCSTDHLGEVCEKTVREEEEDREEHGHGIWGGGDITVEVYGPLKVDDSLIVDPKGKGSGSAAAASASSPTRSSSTTLQAKDINARKEGSKNASGKKKASPSPAPAPAPQSAEDEEKAKNYARLKELVWDARGSGVYAWESYNEEDIWDVELDFGAGKGGRGRRRRAPESPDDDEPPPLIPPKISRSSKRKRKYNNKVAAVFLEDLPLPNHGENPGSNPPDAGEKNPFEEEEAQMTIGEMMEWRYIKAEQEKEMGNVAFRNGQYLQAVDHYRQAQNIEPELPHYQLNLAAAYLKLNRWIEAEKACTKALSQHRSSKGLFRRAKAREMQGKTDGAIQDYRALIRLQPYNTEAMIDLLSLLHRVPEDRRPENTPNDNPWNVKLIPETEAEVAALYDKLGMTKPKRPKPVPFQRTKADDVKLKILAIEPREASVDRDMGSTSSAGGSGVGVGGSPSGSGSGASGSAGASASGNVAAQDEAADASSSSTAKGKLKSGKVRGKEKKEDPGGSGIMRSTAAEYGVAYFAWDRYVVRRVDSS